MKVVAFVPDLLDRSKVAAAGDVSFVSRPEQLAEAATSQGADVVVVDLTRPGVVEVLGQVPVPVIAFANHTRRDLMEAATAAGAHQVMARSAFFARLDELLGGAP
jgi:AmiR/NasT family two-component response regulator